MATRGVSKEFIMSIQGKEFVKYEGLLELAHQEGLKRVSTEIVQFPTEENHYLCIVHATIETAKGIFEGYGDASPKNVNAKIAPHLIRMAETRSKARAFRDATNVGMTAWEELGEWDSGGVSRPAFSKPPDSSPENPGNGASSPVLPSHPPLAPESGVESPPQNGRATQAQINAIWNTGRKRGWTDDEIQGFVQQMLNVSIDRLDKAQASVVIREFQNLNGKGSTRLTHPGGRS